MKQTPCFVFYVLFLTLGGKSAAQQNRYNSFASDLNTCLFNDWAGVLESPGTCNDAGDVQLCYGKHNGNKALFAVCFNKQTHIPKFTANVYIKDGTEGEPNMIGEQECYEAAWKTETGPGFTLAQDQVTNEDYNDDHQKALLGANVVSGINNHYLGKGHLTPDGDFKKDDNCEKSFTYIYTNAAPQWQPFNAGNWAALEQAIRSYADRPTNPGTKTLYIFTGTGGGAAQYNGANIGRLNGKIEVPRYYWKAVCDPQVRQSIVFVAENTPGITDITKVNGCPLTYRKQRNTYNNEPYPQQRNLGIIQCSSVNDAKAAHPLFKLPTFNPASCGLQNVKGTFLDQFLADKLN